MMQFWFGEAELSCSVHRWTDTPPKRQWRRQLHEQKRGDAQTFSVLQYLPCWYAIDFVEGQKGGQYTETRLSACKGAVQKPSRRSSAPPGLLTSVCVRLFARMVTNGWELEKRGLTRHRIHFYPTLSYCCHPSPSCQPALIHTTSVALETSHVLTYGSIPSSLSQLRVLLLSSPSSSPLLL